jgi:hypothetical protein
VHELETAVAIRIRIEPQPSDPAGLPAGLEDPIRELGASVAPLQSHGASGLELILRR